MAVIPISALSERDKAALQTFAFIGILLASGWLLAVIRGGQMKRIKDAR